MAKLLYFVAEDWFFFSHFLARAKGARDCGFDVVVVGREGSHAEAIRAFGMRFIPVPIRRGGTNPLRELDVIRRLIQIYRRERPDVLHHVALKPIIYGSLAARLLGLRAIINAPVGMGYVFTSHDRKARMLRPLVRTLLGLLLHPRGATVVFENPDDLAANVHAGIVRGAGTVLIRGAGVDTTIFRPHAVDSKTPVVTLAARMLRDKGVEEFVTAARSLGAAGVKARFRLAGGVDPANPTSIGEVQLRAWHAEGVVEWLGHCSNMAEIWNTTDIACLPSYREGLPKALLEALACGLPLVATDVPGCRETVESGRNGWLIPPRDSTALADALARLVASPSMRQDFGRRSRQKAVTEFADDVVVRATLRLYQDAVGLSCNS